MITSTGLLLGAHAHVRAHGADGRSLREGERERARARRVRLERTLIGLEFCPGKLRRRSRWGLLGHTIKEVTETET